MRYELTEHDGQPSGPMLPDPEKTHCDFYTMRPYLSRMAHRIGALFPALDFNETAGLKLSWTPKAP